MLHVTLPLHKNSTFTAHRPPRFSPSPVVCSKQFFLLPSYANLFIASIVGTLLSCSSSTLIMFFEINVPCHRNWSTNRYRDFIKASRSSVPGTILLHSAATTNIATKIVLWCPVENSSQILMLTWLLSYCARLYQQIVPCHPLKLRFHPVSHTASSSCPLHFFPHPVPIFNHCLSSHATAPFRSFCATSSTFSSSLSVLSAEKFYTCR